MKVLNKHGEEFDISLHHRDVSPITIVSDENPEDKVLFEGTVQEFEEGVLAVLCPEDEDIVQNTEVFISDEVRAFYFRNQKEGY